MAVEQRRFTDAERLAQEAAAEFKTASVPDMDAASRAVLASALLAEGKISEATAAVAGLRAESRDMKRPGTRLPIALTSARVLSATERSECSSAFINAREVLRSVLAEAKKDGYLEYQFDARLALAELDIRIGHSAAAHAALNTLERDARQKGFGLTLRKEATEIH